MHHTFAMLKYSILLSLIVFLSPFVPRADSQRTAQFKIQFYFTGYLKVELKQWNIDLSEDLMYPRETASARRLSVTFPLELLFEMRICSPSAAVRVIEDELNLHPSVFAALLSLFT